MRSQCVAKNASVKINLKKGIKHTLNYVKVVENRDNRWPFAMQILATFEQFIESFQKSSKNNCQLRQSISGLLPFSFAWIPALRGTYLFQMFFGIGRLLKQNRRKKSNEQLIVYNERQSNFKQPVKRYLTAANKTKSIELLYSISPEVHSSLPSFSPVWNIFKRQVRKHARNR